MSRSVWRFSIFSPGRKPLTARIDALLRAAVLTRPLHGAPTAGDPERTARWRSEVIRDAVKSAVKWTETGPNPSESEKFLSQDQELMGVFSRLIHGAEIPAVSTPQQVPACRQQNGLWAGVSSSLFLLLRSRFFYHGAPRTRTQPRPTNQQSKSKKGGAVIWDAKYKSFVI